MRAGLTAVAAVATAAACAAPPRPSAPCPPPPPATAVVAVARAAPSADGLWKGALGGQLHVEISLRGDSGELDSVDQGARLPISLVTREGDRVRFEVPSVGGVYEGTRTGDRLVGTWTQTGAPRQPLELTRAGDAPPPRPPPPAQAPLDAPVDVSATRPPSVANVDGKHVVAYEIDVASFAPSAMEITGLEVRAAGRSGAVLATFDAHALANMMRTTRVPPGGHAVIAVWLPLTGAAPAALEHRLSLAVESTPYTVDAPHVAISPVAPIVISPPLRGARWVAANGPSETSVHRRAMLPIAGHARFAQRFAIDWVQAGADDATFTGDRTRNASYHAYGQPALAVADGAVLEVKDGIPENQPGEDRAVPITLETIAGNHVVVDLGHGHYAMWAHLQPGSVRVKVGDRVRRGQQLGLVGNSGNSTEPHLHFQVMDAASPLASEGLPYGLDTYRVDGQVHHGEIPAERDLVDL